MSQLADTLQCLVCWMSYAVWFILVVKCTWTVYFGLIDETKKAVLARYLSRQMTAKRVERVKMWVGKGG